jgi:two-component system NtrC family response regulator
MRNVLERAIILSENDLITAGTLPQEIVGALDGTEKRGIFPTLEQSERQLIMRVLNHVGGNRTVAAKMLGIGRKTLYRKMCKFKLPQ